MYVYKPVLDPCCGARKFYFDKEASYVLYGDRRAEEIEQCDGRTLKIAPDKLLDVTNLPYPDNTFALVIFDPPHLVNVGDSSFLAQAYGRLPTKEPLGFVRKAFSECWRVLRPDGTLIFKWGAKDFSRSAVLKAIGRQPLLGEQRPGSNTHWMVFFKPALDEVREVDLCGGFSSYCC